MNELNGSANNGKRPIGVMSLDAQLLYKRITALAVDEMLSYGQLMSVIGREVRPGFPGYGALRTAQMAAERDGVVTEIVPKTGLIRLRDDGIVNNVNKIKSHIHRASRKGVKRLSHVNPAALTAEQKTQYYADASILGALHHASSARAMKRLEKCVAQNNEPLALAATLQAFSS